MNNCQHSRRYAYRPCLDWRGLPGKQFVSLGEQYCESAAQGGPLVTLWPLPAQVHRTVSPTEMLTVSGSNVNLHPAPPPHRRYCR